MKDALHIGIGVIGKLEGSTPGTVVGRDVGTLDPGELHVFVRFSWATCT